MHPKDLSSGQWRNAEETGESGGGESMAAWQKTLESNKNNKEEKRYNKNSKKNNNDWGINKDDEAGQKEREAEKAKAKKPKGAEAPERERAIAMAFYHNGGNVWMRWPLERQKERGICEKKERGRL